MSGGAGIGLLPAYLADRRPELVRVLHDQVVADLTYWMSGRPANLRRPEVATVIRASARRVGAPVRQG